MDSVRSGNAREVRALLLLGLPGLCAAGGGEEAGEAAGAICDTRSEEELAQEQSNCFDVGYGYNPGDWIDFDIVASALDCQTAIPCVAA